MPSEDLSGRSDPIPEKTCRTSGLGSDEPPALPPEASAAGASPGSRWDQAKDFIRRNDVLFKFYGLFAYFMLLFFFLSHWKVTKDHIGYSLPCVIAQSAGFMLNLTGLKTTVHGADVRMPGFCFRIIPHCAGIYAMLIYASAVLAFPATWGERILGVVLGIPILYAVNTIRLVVLGWVVVRYPKMFEYFHEYLWQGIFIVFVIVLWMAWKWLIVRSDRQAYPPAPA